MRTVTTAERANHELAAYTRYPVEIVSGSGMRLQTSAGRELLDFYGGHATVLFGYGHPRLVAALDAQARRLFFQTNLVEVDVRRRAIEALARFAPAGVDRVFLVNSGAEANENALKLAFAYTKRTCIVALRGAFHGRTAAAAACTDGALGKWYGFPRTPFDVTFIEPEDFAALDRAVGADTAAVIAEPVQGQAGARVLSAEFLASIRTLTRERGALFIADEIQCGLGRCAERFVSAAGAHDAAALPDLITLAKGIAGGFPASALLVRDEIARMVRPGDLGTTFGGGPLACAMIEVVVDLLSDQRLLAHVGRMGELIAATCRVGPVESIQGRGLLIGLRTRAPAAELLPRLLAAGILAGSAKDPHIVRLLPPLIVGESEIDALRSALKELR